MPHGIRRLRAPHWFCRCFRTTPDIACALIANGFNLLGLDPFYQQVTLGVILLLAVGVDAWSRRFE